MDQLKRSGKPIHEMVRDYLMRELGEECDFIADTYAESLRFSRRLSIREARRMVKPDRANRIDIVKSLRLID